MVSRLKRIKTRLRDVELIGKLSEMYFTQLFIRMETECIGNVMYEFGKTKFVVYFMSIIQISEF